MVSVSRSIDAWRKSQNAGLSVNCPHCRTPGVIRPLRFDSSMHPAEAGLPPLVMAIVAGLEEQQDAATTARSRLEAEEKRVRDSLADRLTELEESVKQREEQALRCKLEAESTMLTALETRRNAARAEREGNTLKEKYTTLIKDNIALLQQANASARAAQV